MDPHPSNTGETSSTAESQALQDIIIRAQKPDIIDNDPLRNEIKQGLFTNRKPVLIPPEEYQDHLQRRINGAITAEHDRNTILCIPPRYASEQGKNEIIDVFQRAGDDQERIALINVGSLLTGNHPSVIKPIGFAHVRNLLREGGEYDNAVKFDSRENRRSFMAAVDKYTNDIFLLLEKRLPTEGELNKKRLDFLQQYEIFGNLIYGNQYKGLQIIKKLHEEADALKARQSIKVREEGQRNAEIAFSIIEANKTSINRFLGAVDPRSLQRVRYERRNGTTREARRITAYVDKTTGHIIAFNAIPNERRGDARITQVDIDIDPERRNMIVEIGGEKVKPHQRRFFSEPPERYGLLRLKDTEGTPLDQDALATLLVTGRSWNGHI